MNNLQMKMRIKAERKRYEDEDVLHNREIHQRILDAWRQDSPKMTKQLTDLGILDDMAYVSQERMWRAAEAYRRGGLPPTDAREQAERDHLMLEPEEQEPSEPRIPPEVEAAMMPTRR